MSSSRRPPPSTRTALARVLHPDVAHQRDAERDQPRRAPSATAPRPAQAFERGKGLLSAQTYDVHEVIAAGDTIAARATWRGTLAATGQELTAHIATFSEVRDGRIFRHATYDCYEPSD